MIVVDRLLFFADKIVAEWVQARAGGGVPTGACATIGVLQRSELVAGIVFYGYRPGCDVEIALAIASPRHASRRWFRAGFHYAFEQLGVPRITAQIDLTHTRCIKLAIAHGFVREGVKRRASSTGGDVGVFGLLRDDYRKATP